MLADSGRYRIEEQKRGKDVCWMRSMATRRGAGLGGMVVGMALLAIAGSAWAQTAGLLDTSFNGTGFTLGPTEWGPSYGQAVAVQTDGKPVIGGQFNSNPMCGFVVRYNLLSAGPRFISIEFGSRCRAPAAAAGARSLRSISRSLGARCSPKSDSQRIAKNT